jgi:hypothetical protein
MKCAAVLAVIAAAAAIGGVSTARAGIVMTVNVGGVDTPVSDNGSKDSDPATGVINASRVLGSAFPFAITLGTSDYDPATDTVTQSISILIRNKSTSVQNITITLSNTDFTAPNVLLDMTSSVSGMILRGATGDSVSFQSYADPSGTLNGKALTSGQQLSPSVTRIVAGASSPNAHTSYTINGAYSVTSVAAITLSPGAQANLSATTLVVGPGAGGNIPEPATLGTLGVAALALLARRRRAL